jgi:hypothetical protein
MYNLLNSRLLKILLLVIGFNTLISSSCSKDDDVIAPSTPVSGSWKVSYYFDSGDETANFSSFTFTFNAGGQLVAANSLRSYTGTWSQTSTKLIIDFGADPLLSDLSNDWLIDSQSSSIIKLKDDNPARPEQLQFTKL